MPGYSVLWGTVRALTGGPEDRSSQFMLLDTRIHTEGVSGSGEVGYLHYLQLKTCEKGCSPHCWLFRFVVS